MIIVSLWPIFTAALCSTLIGLVWYQILFRNATHDGGTKPGIQKMLTSIPIGFIAAMLIAYVMGYFGIAWGVGDWIGALELGFWSWIGFVAPTMLSDALWKKQPMKLYAIHAGRWLVTFIVMALALVYVSAYITPPTDNTDMSGQYAGVPVE